MTLTEAAIEASPGVIEAADFGNREPVILNVYDMFWTNEYTGNMGLGVYHSGLEVYGREYAYGGHPFNFSGIFDIAPRAAGELGDQFRFKQAIHVGNTDFRACDVEKIIEELGKEFRGDRYVIGLSNKNQLMKMSHYRYHLMSRNCNHFSGALSMILVGKDIPSWVNRLAYFSTCVPFLQRCLPKEWLTPHALETTIESRNQEQQQQKSLSEQNQSGGNEASSSTSSTSAVQRIRNEFARSLRGRKDSTTSSTATETTHLS